MNQWSDEMSRLLNMADPKDCNVLKETQDSYAKDVRAILADRESKAALDVLRSKGWSSSRVHGAYSSLMRKSSGA